MNAMESQWLYIISMVAIILFIIMVMLYLLWKCRKWIEIQTPDDMEYEELHDIATPSTGRFCKKHSVALIPITEVSWVLPKHHSSTHLYHLE